MMKANHTFLFLFLCITAGWSIPRVQAASENVAKQLGSNIADAVETVMPAVVVIRTRETRYRIAQDWFFGYQQIPEHQLGQGSGVILTKDGYVLTNNHVVDSADEIQVTLADGRVFPAALVGRDTNSDLAVLKIQSDNDLPYAEIADSDTLRVGEFVIAIGSPFSLASTVTLGTVSQTGRQFGPMPFVEYIQTDAAINQGNSGGPLIDVDGKVVGINTFIQTASPYSSGSVGIGFAVPGNLALRVFESIRETGESQIPWIGIIMQTEPLGVRIVQTHPSGPAARNGLLSGDLIRAMGDEKMHSTLDVKRFVQKHRVGERLLMEVERNADTLHLEVIPEALPEFSGFIR